MSLVSNEGEGEQNEIRILQDKLNSTMKLVSHLTAQLNELKEQVCTQAYAGPTLGSHTLQLQTLTGRLQPSLPRRGGEGAGTFTFFPFLLGFGVEDRFGTLFPPWKARLGFAAPVSTLKDMAEWSLGAV